MEFTGDNSEIISASDVAWASRGEEIQSMNIRFEGWSFPMCYSILLLLLLLLVLLLFFFVRSIFWGFTWFLHESFQTKNTYWWQFIPVFRGSELTFSSHHDKLVSNFFWWMFTPRSHWEMIHYSNYADLMVPVSSPLDHRTVVLVLILSTFNWRNVLFMKFLVWLWHPNAG